MLTACARSRRPLERVACGGPPIPYWCVFSPIKRLLLGHPIPTSEGALAKRDLKSLDQFRPGQSVVIREVQDDNPDRLRRWQTLWLTPGAKVQIVSYQPLDDMFQLRVGEQVIPVGSEGLAGVRGELSS